MLHFGTLGPGFFRRFCKENPDVQFLNKGEEDKYKYDTIKPSHWADDNVRYIKENNNGYLCWSPQSILVVEAKTIVWTAAKDLSFIVVVSCNVLIHTLLQISINKVVTSNCLKDATFKFYHMITLYNCNS